MLNLACSENFLSHKTMKSNKRANIKTVSSAVFFSNTIVSSSTLRVTSLSCDALLTLFTGNKTKEGKLEYMIVSRFTYN